MADITIFGAGIFGLSLAYTCARRGASVQVIDPHGPGAGSSGGLVGALAPHVPENWNAKKAFQLESLLAAEAFWTDVEKVGGVSAGYGRLGRVQPIADQAGLELALARVESSKKLWNGQAEWRVVSGNELGAFLPVSPTGQYIHDTLTARMHPRQACSALVAALEVLGVPVTAEGTAKGAVVWATGWQGLRALSEDLGVSVGSGIKGQSVTLRHAAVDAPQVFVDGLHIVPHADGTVAIGSTTEREFEDPSSTDEQIDALIERAREALPVLSGATVVELWAGVRPRARSRAPMMGAWPGREGQFVLNGGFKIGFGMSVKCAEVMADLVLDGVDTVPEEFRVEASIPKSTH